MSTAWRCALTVVGTTREQPSPQHLRPCCPCTDINPCQYSPGFVRGFLMARNLAEIMREPWDVVLADKLGCHCGTYDQCRCPVDGQLLVQSLRGENSVAERARDIVISLERCRDELGIPLTFTSIRRLSAALCRFAVDQDL